MSIQADGKDLTEAFGNHFKEDIDSYQFGCGMVDKAHTVYVGKAEAFEEDEEIGFDLELLSERPEKVVYKGELKHELYEFVPEEGDSSFISDNLLERVMEIFEMDSPNDYFDCINLHPAGEWPVVIEHPMEDDTIAVITPRITR